MSFGNTQMVVDVIETSARTFVAAEWRNGCLTMRADIRNGFDVRLAERMAKELGADFYVTQRAQDYLEDIAA